MKFLQKAGLSLLLFVLGLLIAFQYKAASSGHYVLSGDSRLLGELKQEVANLRERNNQLLASLNEKKANLSRLMAAQEDKTSRDEELEKRYRDVLTFAGLTEVRGPGTILRLTSASTASLKASTLRDLINEFKAGGAEAISVNGQRVVAMTDVRSTGANEERILMNGSLISSERGYEIRVIGEIDAMKNVVSLLQNFKNSLQEAGIQTDVEYLDQLTVPALDESSPAYRSALLRSEAS